MQDQLREEKRKYTQEELDKKHKELMNLSDLIVEQSFRLAKLAKDISSLECSKYQPLEVHDLKKEKNILWPEYEKNCELQEKLSEEFFKMNNQSQLKK